MRAKMAFIVFVIIDIILILSLGVINDLTQIIHNKKVVFVPKGSAKKIITYLNKTYGYNLNLFDPYILVKFGKVNHGYLDLNVSSISKIDFLKALAKAKPKILNITLIPGETTYIFLKNLSNDENLSYEKMDTYLKNHAPFYEGFLVPNTYKITKGSSEEDIMKKLLAYSFKFHNKVRKDFLNDANLTTYKKIITKASVIQKEAASIKEMGLISGVIDNRISKNMKLQMDGTLNYGKYSHQKITSQRIKEDKSEFNTYIHEGLPKSPVCAVSVDAIMAAINPIKSEYLYFFKPKNQNSHIFSKTYEKHYQHILDSNSSDKNIIRQK